VRQRACAAAVVSDGHDQCAVMADRKGHAALGQADALDRCGGRTHREQTGVSECHRDGERRLVLHLDDGEAAVVGHRVHALHRVAVGYAYAGLHHGRAVDAALPNCRFALWAVPPIVGRDVPIQHGAITPRLDSAPCRDGRPPATPGDTGRDLVRGARHGAAHSISLLRVRCISEPSASRAGRPWWHTATTCSVIGMSTP